MRSRCVASGVPASSSCPDAALLPSATLAGAAASALRLGGEHGVWIGVCIGRPSQSIARASQGRVAQRRDWDESAMMRHRTLLRVEDPRPVAPRPVAPRRPSAARGGCATRCTQRAAEQRHRVRAPADCAGVRPRQREGHGSLASEKALVCSGGAGAVLPCTCAASVLRRNTGTGADAGLLAGPAMVLTCQTWHQSSRVRVVGHVNMAPCK